MKCEKARELYSDHLEGAMERPMAVAFEQHLAECSECARDFASFKTTWEMLNTLPEVTPPPGFAWDVVMKIRIQREAEQRAKSRWQIVWSNFVASRVPAKVFATGFAAFMMFQVVTRTPLRGVIVSYLGTPTRVKTQVPSTQPAWNPKQIAEAWLHSGLSFELDSSDAREGTSVVRLLLKPQGVSSKQVRVYLMDPGHVRFDQEGAKNASLLFDGTVDRSGQVIPFVLRYNGNQQTVTTALVEWEHKGRKFMEAVFMPTQLNPIGVNPLGSMNINESELYSALQQVSATFRVVILAQADISARVKDIQVNKGTPDDALYKTLSDIGLSWRPLGLGSQVYAIERKVE
jgi:hypothetical protein